MTTIAIDLSTEQVAEYLLQVENQGLSYTFTTSRILEDGSLSLYLQIEDKQDGMEINLHASGKWSAGHFLPVAPQ